METKIEKKRIDKFFKLAISLKGIYAHLEIITGAIFLFVSPIVVTQLIDTLTQSELVEDPHDFFANTLVHIGSQISISTTMFIGLYLILNGFVKVILLSALLKNKKWAYPLSFIILGLFVTYQVYRLTLVFSISLSFLIVLDSIIIWLIWREYKNKLD